MSLRARRLLAAAGIVAASIVIGTCATVGYGLATGFDRAAEQADLPDVIARFDRERLDTLDARVRALPNLQARSYRTEIRDVYIDHEDRPGQFVENGVLNILGEGRRGYAITEGRDLSDASREVVVERGLAREWDLKPGSSIDVGRIGDLQVVGIAVSPDNVAYPLSKTARVYTGEQEIQERFQFRGELEPNVAMLWLNDTSRADITLAQARAVSFGIGSLTFITREGVRVLLSQAAGIIISLLIAFGDQPGEGRRAGRLGEVVSGAIKDPNRLCAHADRHRVQRVCASMTSGNGSFIRSAVRNHSELGSSLRILAAHYAY